MILRLGEVQVVMPTLTGQTCGFPLYPLIGVRTYAYRRTSTYELFLTMMSRVGSVTNSTKNCYYEI